LLVNALYLHNTNLVLNLCIALIILVHDFTSKMGLNESIPPGRKRYWTGQVRFLLVLRLSCQKMDTIF